jgi:hypothetical protein
MAFNIQDFRSSLRYDGARPNLFEVSMSTINVGVANIDPQMVFKCRAAQLPEDNLGVIPVNYMEFTPEIKELYEIHHKTPLNGFIDDEDLIN